MAKDCSTAKKIIIAILILLGGAGLTAGSYCLYYLVIPLHTAIVAVICVVDYLYNFFVSAMAIKYSHEERWLLKGLAFSFGYTVLFVPASALFLIFANGASLITDHIVEIILSAFFTGPSILIVLAVVFLFMYGAGGG